MNKLKPCPFCGKEYADIFYGHYSNEFHAECAGCHARTGHYKTKDESFAAWNCRTAGWISVDNYPETAGMPCLLCGVNSFNQTAVFQGFTGYCREGINEYHSNVKDVDIKNYKITHWMPMPESPLPMPQKEERDDTSRSN